MDEVKAHCVVASQRAQGDGLTRGSALSQHVVLIIYQRGCNWRLRVAADHIIRIGSPTAMADTQVASDITISRTSRNTGVWDGTLRSLKVFSADHKNRPSKR